MTWDDVTVVEPGSAEGRARVETRQRDRTQPKTEARPTPAPRNVPGKRSVSLTPASTIDPRPVKWLWQDRLPRGALALIGGREGIGKSTLAYKIAAAVSRGALPGSHYGTPKGVIVAATEDSWAHTIVPRLMAADADLTRIYRVDVTSSDDVATELSLPRDVTALGRHVQAADVGLVLLDPLMSRLDGKRDTHKDAEVRLALEPLVHFATRNNVSVLGLIHVNKSTASDPLTMLMGSRAFAAVARAVLFVMTDPDDESLRLLGQAKNNLGRSDLPVLTYRIESTTVAQTDEGPVVTGRVVWLGESDRTLGDAIACVGESGEARTAIAEAGDWLDDYLTTQGGEADSKDIRGAGAKAGHSADALKRARIKRGIASESYGFPRKTKWVLPSGGTSGESAPTALTALAGDVQ